MIWYASLNNAASMKWIWLIYFHEYWIFAPKFINIFNISIDIKYNLPGDGRMEGH